MGLIGKEFGDPTSYHGIYHAAGFREVELFEFDRGTGATGIRGIIDPFDPANPYCKVDGTPGKKGKSPGSKSVVVGTGKSTKT